MFEKILPKKPLSSTNPAFSYQNKIVPHFLSIEELIEKAQTTTESCVHSEQLQVSKQFFKNVAFRGVYQKKYTIEEARKVGIIVDYIAQNRSKKMFSDRAI